MGSPYIRKLKALAYARDGGLCLCGDEATDLAHLTYERFGHELLADVISSCSPCNQAERVTRLLRPPPGHQQAAGESGL